MHCSSHVTTMLFLHCCLSFFMLLCLLCLHYYLALLVLLPLFFSHFCFTLFTMLPHSSHIAIPSVVHWSSGTYWPSFWCHSFHIIIILFTLLLPLSPWLVWDFPSFPCHVLVEARTPSFRAPKGIVYNFIFIFIFWFWVFFHSFCVVSFDNVLIF